MDARRPNPTILPRTDSLGAIFYKDPNGIEHTCAVPIDDAIMWQDDEDNNPYGSFNQDSAGTTNPVLGASCMFANHIIYELRLTRMIDHDQEQPSTPPSSQSSPNTAPEFLSRPPDLSDEEEEYGKNPGSGYLQKGSYDSRIQQILYENPELEIIITEAGKSPDGGYIVYRIRTGVRNNAPSRRVVG
jgi:hypothetical protein